jgi:hypothetical protein
VAGGIGIMRNYMICTQLSFNILHNNNNNNNDNNNTLQNDDDDDDDDDDSNNNNNKHVSRRNNISHITNCKHRTATTLYNL